MLSLRNGNSFFKRSYDIGIHPRPVNATHPQILAVLACPGRFGGRVSICYV